MGKKIALFAALLAALALAGGLLLPYDGRKTAENPLPPLETAPAVFDRPADDPVDLNAADEQALMTLPEIGQVRARAILAYRETCGPFQSVEELAAVDGIGPGILELVRPYVTVGK